MELLIGIDGGGTKTDLALCDTAGTVVNRVREGPCNPNDIGITAAADTLKRGLRSLLSLFGTPRVISLFAGISGGTTGEHQAKIHTALKTLFDPRTLIRNHSDAICALSGGLGRENGCAVIAGTGSIGYARNGGEILRVGGYGYHIDRGGSGYDLGRDAWYHALCHKDGRGEKTLITQLLEEQAGDLLCALGTLYEKGRHYIASFAPVVFRAYEAGDGIAEQIIEKNAAELAKLFNVLGRFSGKDNCGAVLSGSVFQSFSAIKPYLLPRLAYEFTFLFPQLPPVFGAITEAALEAGIPVTEEFKHNFKRTWEGK